MKVKIAVTISDFGAALHMGADTERVTSVIELTEEQIPNILKKYIENDLANKESYITLSFSLFKEDI